MNYQQPPGHGPPPYGGPFGGGPPPVHGPYGPGGMPFGSPGGGFRPPANYGSPAPGVPPPGPTGKQTEIMGTLSLIFGLLSIPGHFCCYLGWPLGVASIVLGIISIVKINSAPERWTGKGLAIGGIVSSVVGFLVIVGLLIVYGVALFALTP